MNTEPRHVELARSILAWDERLEHLTDWERAFCLTLSTWFNRISVKQSQVLAGLVVATNAEAREREEAEQESIIVLDEVRRSERQSS